MDNTQNDTTALGHLKEDGAVTGRFAPDQELADAATRAAERQKQRDEDYVNSEPAALKEMRKQIATIRDDMDRLVKRFL